MLWLFHFPLKVSFLGWMKTLSWERRPFPVSYPDSSSVKFLCSLGKSYCHRSFRLRYKVWFRFMSANDLEGGDNCILMRFTKEPNWKLLQTPVVAAINQNPRENWLTTRDNTCGETRTCDADSSEEVEAFFLEGERNSVESSSQQKVSRMKWNNECPGCKNLSVTERGSWEECGNPIDLYLTSCLLRDGHLTQVWQVSDPRTQFLVLR